MSILKKTKGHEYAVEVGYDVIMMLINPATGKLESYFSNPKYRGKLDNYDTLSELLNVDVAPPAAPAPRAPPAPPSTQYGRHQQPDTIAPAGLNRGNY